MSLRSSLCTTLILVCTPVPVLLFMGVQLPIRSPGGLEQMVPILLLAVVQLSRSQEITRDTWFWDPSSMKGGVAVPNGGWVWPLEEPRMTRPSPMLTTGTGTTMRWVISSPRSLRQTQPISISLSSVTGETEYRTVKVVLTLTEVLLELEIMGLWSLS